MNSKEVLKERSEIYGDPYNCHKCIGMAWASILDISPINPTKVALMMTMFKIIRAKYVFQEDNFIDARNYLKFAEDWQREKEDTVDTLKKINKCDICNKFFDVEKEGIFYKGFHYCNSCAKNGELKSCSLCHKSLYKDQSVEKDGVLICLRCSNTLRKKCYDCGKEFDLMSSGVKYNGNYFCCDCWKKKKEKL